MGKGKGKGAAKVSGPDQRSGSKTFGTAQTSRSNSGGGKGGKKGGC